MSLAGTLARKGAPVTFPGGTASTYDPITETWSGGATSSVTANAMQIEGDPDRFRALNLVLNNPVTLLVDAAGLSVVPTPGMAMTWAGTTYTIKDVEAAAMNGVASAYRITGSV